ncbi:DUF1800 domain-containing protein [bacterium]|nr:DUF1800 domain-containing protein [bacterium]
MKQTLYALTASIAIAGAGISTAMADAQTGPESRSEAAAFLNQATFGATAQDIQYVMSLRSYGRWLGREFRKPYESILDEVVTVAANSGGGRTSENQSLSAWLERSIKADDQLRYRAAYALSQVFATSTATSLRKSVMHAYFKDVMLRNAFGNFRDLLEDVTYSQLMGNWLTYINSPKANVDTGSAPDENYAREIMQLFTIGLVELHNNGTSKTRSGVEVETYTQEDVTGLAKVFTGLHRAGSSFGARSPTNNDVNDIYPMQMDDNYHSMEEKSFLGITIPANTSGDESIRIALDKLFNHSNTGPFIAKALIKQLVTSNPSGRYVSSVATAFNTGFFAFEDSEVDYVFGNGQRGDMKAVWAAILLNDSARDPRRYRFRSFAKVREPNLRFMHWARISEVEGFDLGNRHTLFPYGQAMPFRASSVFNFFRPGYMRPGTITAAEGLSAPELQLASSSGIINYINTMRDYAVRSPIAANFAPQYTTLMSYADKPEELIQLLNEAMTGGRLEAVSQEKLLQTLNEISLPEDGDDSEARRNRVKAAVGLVITSIEFMTAQ